MDEQLFQQLNDASLTFLSPLTETQLYECIVKEGVALADADSGSIYLGDQGNLSRVYASDNSFSQIHIRKNGFTYKAYKTQKPYVVSVAAIAEAHPKLKDSGIRSVIHIPLSYQQKSIGVLNIQSRKVEKFTDKALKLLEVFGSMASLAIQKVHSEMTTQKALETRDLFISIASHELRTPLTSMSGYAQLLHNKLSKTDSIEARWSEELLFETNRLTVLIKELLEVNRIKQGQLQFVLRECALAEVAKKAIEREKVSGSKHVISFENKVKSDLIIGDGEKLLQVISGILHNAQKFSPPSSPITICLLSKKNDIILQIIDKGKGFDQVDLPRIFEGFYKDEDSFHSGMGIGLLLAKHIVEYHHGSLDIHSQVDKGTIVEIRLPRLVYT